MSISRITADNWINDAASKFAYGGPKNAAVKVGTYKAALDQAFDKSKIDAADKKILKTAVNDILPNSLKEETMGDRFEV